jgi:hypothetical protein
VELFGIGFDVTQAIVSGGLERVWLVALAS